MIKLHQNSNQTKKKRKKEKKLHLFAVPNGLTNLVFVFLFYVCIPIDTRQ